ncbi:MAG: DUF4058 family protein [Isosphaeraceae bacterium]
MPVHDWNRIDTATFHDFHNSWIIHLKETLNGGVLPPDYFALSDQRSAGVIPDILTLNLPGNGTSTNPVATAGPGGIAVAEAPPRIGRKLVADSDAVYRFRRRTLVVRHVSGNQVVALLEIVSPSNKDRPSTVQDFVSKVDAALAQGIHVIVVDLFRPGKHDPEGMTGAIWANIGSEQDEVPSSQPLTLCSYRAVVPVEAYIEHVAFGQPLPDMPLFLDAETYINVPLETTYQAAFRGMPAFIQQRLEAQA